jgi:prepilin-type N-terminal cleavage/methylation domain-containing protein
MAINSSDQRTGNCGAFTLIELLTVISILALLAAILEPALLQAKRMSLRVPCGSNLHQIGLAFDMYGVDWNDYYPWAIDVFTRTNPEAMQDYPPPVNLIPDLVATLSVYTGGHGQVWRCPADNSTFQLSAIGQSKAQSFPSVFAFAGTSYIFSDQTYFGKSQTSLNETELRLGSDALFWHCQYPDPSVLTKTQNVLFGDDHVRFVSMMDRS